MKKEGLIALKKIKEEKKIGEGEEPLAEEPFRLPPN